MAGVASLDPLVASIVDGGALLVVGVSDPPDVPGFSRVVAVEALEALATGTEPERFDAAWGTEPAGDDVAALARALRARVRSGGVVALAMPRPRGLRRWIGRRPTVSREELCESLLRAGVRDLQVRAGLVYGRVSAIST